MSDMKVMDVLEELVDRHGVGYVLDMLSCVCGDKAEHVRANWQDAGLARIWDAVANKLAAVQMSDRIKEIDAINGHK